MSTGQLASLGRCAQLTRCFSAVAELLVLIAVVDLMLPVAVSDKGLCLESERDGQQAVIGVW